MYSPNKVILWDDAIGKEVAELEFRERVRGLACRRGWLAVALRRRVVVFEIGERIKRHTEWDTCDNPRGALSPWPFLTHVILQRLRSTRDRDWSIFYTTGYTRSADGTCSTGASAPLPPTASPRPTNLYTSTEATTRTGKASYIHHRRTHDCPNYIICPSVWSIARYHFCEGNFGAGLGLTYWQACP